MLILILINWHFELANSNANWLDFHLIRPITEANDQ